jgi:hypothetical protein
MAIRRRAVAVKAARASREGYAGFAERAEEEGVSTFQSFELRFSFVIQISTFEFDAAPSPQPSPRGRGRFFVAARIKNQ